MYWRGEWFTKGGILIDRKTKWGNPFILKKGGSREEVVKQYQKYLWQSIKDGTFSLEELASLHGKDLVCHCAPLLCHGNILEKAAEWAYSQINLQNEKSDKNITIS